MNQFGMRNIDVPPAGFLELEAQVDVIERHSKPLLVEPADLLILGLVDHQTGCRNRSHKLRDVRLPKISRIVRTQGSMCVPRGTADADDNSGMLARSTF